MKIQNFKGTRGNIVAGQKNGNSDGAIFHVAVDNVNEPANEICTLYGSPNDSLEEARANASLIAEAFNVVNETGYTPKQLAEQKAELLEALKIAYEQIKISERQIPLKDGFNLATEQGKAGWKIFLDKMVKIEAAIKNAEQ